MIGFGQGARIGKSSSIALEASMYEINTFVRRNDKETICFGGGAQIGKSSYRT